MKNYGISALVALVVSLGVFFAVPQFTDFGKSVKIEHVSGTPAQGALYTADENGNMIPVDFTQLAEKAMDADDLQQFILPPDFILMSNSRYLALLNFK
jgi:hypothetical protein